MKLESLGIRELHSYEAGYDATRPNRYKGDVEFKGSNGTIKILLGPEICSQVLAIVAESMAKETRRLADDMTAEIFNQAALPPIEAPVKPSDQDDDIPF